MVLYKLYVLKKLNCTGIRYSIFATIVHSKSVLFPLKLEVILPCLETGMQVYMWGHCTKRGQSITSQQPCRDTLGQWPLWIKDRNKVRERSLCSPAVMQYMITDPAPYLPVGSWLVVIFEHGWSGTVNWYQISVLDHMASIRNPKAGFAISWRHGLEFYLIIFTTHELTCITGLNLNSN